MKLSLTTLTILTTISFNANAGCGLSSEPCSQGNGYESRNTQNLGGGYNTYNNGQLQSQTNQNLGGGYTRNNNDGTYSTQNNNGYTQNQNENSDGGYGHRRNR